MSDESKPIRYVEFTPAYKEECFEAWYRAGCPSSIKSTMAVIPPNTNGPQPKATTITAWKEDMGWSQRADIYDARVAQEMESELVEQRKKMLRKHAEEGEKLQELGMKYLEGGTGIESDSTALRAVLEGAVLERTSLGLSEALTRIMKMSDDQLVTEIQNILKNARQGRDDKIIDMGEMPPEDETDNGTDSETTLETGELE
jgi:hypothetical protein